MTKLELSDIRKQFVCYVNGFTDTGAEQHPLLQLKAKHCECVAAEAHGISSDLGWPVSGQNAAEALGFLHDVGRFSQFAEFGTFSDSASVDHGKRGWTAIRQAGWLSRLPSEERNAILDGVRCHNRQTIPGNLGHQSLAFVRLVRDADKLDIFRVVLDAVERDGFRDLPTMLPNVTLDRHSSPLFVDEIFRRKTASLKNVKSLADFLLMQVSWVYDLNYIPAFERLHDRGILSRILGQLDRDSRAHALVQEAHRIVQNHIGEHNYPTAGKRRQGKNFQLPRQTRVGRLEHEQAIRW
ncbi:MAG: HD domain-containing protein [Kiritimatiellia bacterium]|nr:HD domain-containing protein [Kiritimatiellia bacterium]